MVGSQRAVRASRSATCWGVGWPGDDARINATAAVTWGAAIDVPSQAAYSVSSSVRSSDVFIGSVDRMLVPGAIRWTWAPVFENEARRLDSVVAPTAITPS